MRIIILSAATILTGCTAGSPNEIGQFGEEEGIQCEAVSATPLSDNEIVEVGYDDSPQQVDIAVLLAAASGAFEETLEWSDGAQAQVIATLSDAATAELVVTEDVGSGPESEPAECPTIVTFSLSVGLTTSGGLVDDTFSTVATTLGDRIYVEDRITDPGGTLDIEALAASGVQVEPDLLRVNFWVEDDDFGGQLLPQPIGEPDDDAPPLGSWPVSSSESM